MNKNTNFNLNEYYLLIFCILTFFTGFILNENSTGGAYIDYVNQKNISLKFANDFFNTLDNYENFGTRHSPVVPILLSFFENLKLNDVFIRLIYLIFCLALPITFAKCLFFKFKNISNKTVYFLISLIFLSPTYRSLSIWPDSRILGLAFFTLSIYFYLKFQNNKKIKYVYFNISCLALSSYISPNFSVFSIFFFVQYFNIYNFSKKLIYITILNLLLAAPAFYFIFIEKHNFLFTAKAIAPALTEANMNNYFNKILIIPSILFFYLLPFLFTKIIKINFKKYTYPLIATSIIFLFSVANFNYPYEISGGGIFLKLSYKIFNNIYLFYFFSFISIFVIFLYFGNSFNNLLIFILIVISNPQLSVYHKYYDPVFLIMIYLLFKIKINNLNLLIFKNKFFIFSYYFFFLFLSLIKGFY